MKKKKFIIITLIFFLLISMIALDPRHKVVTYTIKTDKVSQPVTIAFIADLHSCDYGKNQNKLIKDIDKHNPDIILLGGDIVDDRMPWDKAEEFLSLTAPKYPSYYVSGNHEFWSGNIKAIKNMIRDYGVTILEGDTLPLSVNGEIIELCGIDDPEIGISTFNKQLSRCGKSIHNDIYSILLTHRPERIESYLKYDFDLILSGHAHGGQWRIPLLLNGLLAPDQGLFPKYAGGRYNFAPSTFIVSRGLARETTRVPRIFNRPEIVIINIEP